MAREEIAAHLLGYCEVSEKTLQSLLPFFHSVIIPHYLCCGLNRCGLIITERSPSGSRHLLHYRQNSDVVGVHQNAGPLGVSRRWRRESCKNQSPSDEQHKHVL